MNELRGSNTSALNASLVQTTVDKVDASMNYLLEAHVVLDSALGDMQKDMMNVLRLLNALGFEDKCYYDLVKLKGQVNAKLKKLKDRVEGRSKINGMISDQD